MRATIDLKTPKPTTVRQKPKVSKCTLSRKELKLFLHKSQEEAKQNLIALLQAKDGSGKSKRNKYFYNIMKEVKSFFFFFFLFPSFFLDRFSAS